MLRPVVVPLVLSVAAACGRGTPDAAGAGDTGPDRRETATEAPAGGPEGLRRTAPAGADAREPADAARAGDDGSGSPERAGADASDAAPPTEAGAADAEAAEGGAAEEGGSAKPVAPAVGKKLRRHVWVIGYYATYLFRRYRPAEVRYDALTHLAVTRAYPGEDGALVADFGRDGEAGEALVGELVRRAHEAGTRALLVVGGGGSREGLARAATGEARAAFVADLVEFARARGFDGLDLDWEPFREGDARAIAALAADLRAAWPEADLTAAAPHLAADRTAADPGWARAAEPLDRVNLMTYGMAATEHLGRSWHSAALHGAADEGYGSIDHSVRGYLAAGVPAERLGIGIGFFGICYTPPVDGPRQELRRATVAAADCSMSYADIRRRYFDPAARRWDAEARAPYLALPGPRGPHGCGFVSYEDGQSIAERAAYVAERGLGGAIVWAINEGYMRWAPEGERDPLMEALGKHFLGR